VDLEAHKLELHQEIEQLSRKHEILILGVTTRDTVWSVAVEYFRVFRRGLLAARGARFLGLNFLKATMTRDLDAGTVQGLEALARNWPRPSRSTFGMSSFGWGDWTRLVDQRLVMRGSVRFNWDGNTNRVESLITQADMALPLLQLLIAGQLGGCFRWYSVVRASIQSATSS
ncbi:hypothetical protein JG688_00005018, partial [Phytophthora aleatoria]